jgi:hypothetical protein
MSGSSDLLCGLLFGAEYVCHANYCITQIAACQVFLCYTYSAMKLLAIAMLLTIMQAPPPVPRKAANHPAKTGENSQRQTNDDKAPAPKPDAALNPDAAKRNEAKGEKVESKNTAQPIQVTQLPNVTVNPSHRDWADWGIWVFNFFLVVVGGFQVFLLWGTLRAIRRQADQMERQTTKLEESIVIATDSAKAALLNAQAVINSERPWMFIATNPAVGNPRETHVKFTAVNRGRTPAEIIAYTGDFTYAEKAEDLDPAPHYGLAGLELAHKKYMCTGDSFEVFDFDCSAIISQQQWEENQRNRKRLIFIGHVVYRDLITRDKHETCYCYWLSPVPWIGLIIGGPPEYNKHN